MAKFFIYLPHNIVTLEQLFLTHIKSVLLLKVQYVRILVKK